MVPGHAAGQRPHSRSRTWRAQAAAGPSAQDDGRARLRSALERQRQVAAGMTGLDAGEQLRRLVRDHFEVLLGSGSDFHPVMLHEALHADLGLARRLILGALDGSVQGFDRRKEASRDDLVDVALALFIGEPA